MRTVNALLLPNCQYQGSFDEHPPISRKFATNDPVYAQVHRVNSWKWLPGTIIERVGKVMYNVLLEDGNRLIRSHCNQLRRRNDSAPTTTQIQSPLSVFLDVFQIPPTQQPDEPAFEGFEAEPAFGGFEGQDDPPIPEAEPHLPMHVIDPMVAPVEKLNEPRVGEPDEDCQQIDDDQPVPEAANVPSTSTPLRQSSRVPRLPSWLESYWVN